MSAGIEKTAEVLLTALPSIVRTVEVWMRDPARNEEELQRMHEAVMTFRDQVAAIARPPE